MNSIFYHMQQPVTSLSVLFTFKAVLSDISKYTSFPYLGCLLSFASNFLCPYILCVSLVYVAIFVFFKQYVFTKSLVVNLH